MATFEIRVSQYNSVGAVRKVRTEIVGIISSLMRLLKMHLERRDTLEHRLLQNLACVCQNVKNPGPCLILFQAPAS